MIKIILIGARQRDTPVADARGLVTILNLLPGKKAAEFRAKSADIIVRYLGGDETLIQEIKDIRELQEELRNAEPEHPARIFGDTIERERQRAPGLPEWATEWRESRTEQKNAGKDLRAAIANMGYDSVRVRTSVENAKNQAVVGFDGNTTAFKKQHNIPVKAALADWMTRDQLDMRRMMANKLKRTFENMEDPTSTEMKRTAEEIRDRTSEMCEFMGIQGFSESHWAARVRELELKQATIEARQQLLEENVRAQKNININTVTTLNNHNM